MNNFTSIWDFYKNIIEKLKLKIKELQEENDKLTQIIKNIDLSQVIEETPPCVIM